MMPAPLLDPRRASPLLVALPALLPDPYETVRDWGDLPEGTYLGSFGDWGYEDGEFSRISGLFIDADDVLYAIDSESGPNYNPGWRKGLRVGSAETGEVWHFVREHMSERAFGMGEYGSMGEGVTADDSGNVFAGEVGPVQGLTKFVPRLIP